MAGRKIKGTDQQFDPEFHFLLALDSTFEEWRVLAAEWWLLAKRHAAPQQGLTGFFVTYLHGKGLDKSPSRLLDASAQVPDLWTTLGLDSVGKEYAQQTHDWVSDFIDWVLRDKFSEPDADGHRIVPDRWRNPFPRKSPKQHGKRGDLSYRHVLTTDPRMAAWVAYAAEYIQTVRENQWPRSCAVDAFLTRYVIKRNQPRDPLEFLKRTTEKLAFIDVLVNTRARHKNGKTCEAANEKPSLLFIKQNTYAADFIDWVLLHKLSVEGEHGERVIPAVFHNPIERLSQAGTGNPSETVKNALPMLYIRKLRKMLAEGRNFLDWKWAQQSTDSGCAGDWFIVDPTLVKRGDPDCVWRERRPGLRERKANNLPEIVTEIWSPVRAMVIYVKLELALRTHQVRFLDSGEGDTWRYEWDALGGRFKLNDTLFAQGCEARPSQRGVFHRAAGTAGAGFFINTNKTADINKPEDEKGYVVPWTHIELLYWLEKLRNWQERYNPVDGPMPWTELEARYFSARPAEAILAERSPAVFLFRDATAEDRNRAKPVLDGVLQTLWYKLLVCLEAELAKDKEKDSCGNPIRLVDPDSRLTTYFPLHALRVSLITGLIMEGGLPIEVVSKLIVGHHGLIQTLYYTKIGIDHMNKLMADAEHKMTENEARGHKIFLMRHGRDEINQRFASISQDGVTAAMNQKSEAGFVFDDKGLCPVGCAMCDVGGEKISEAKGRNDYAPVPGYPHERNCIRCRFFLTGPAWLHALNAKFNHIAYQAMLAAERYNSFTEQVAALEERRAESEAMGCLFTEAVDLEKKSALLEAETQTLDRWITDLQVIERLIHRSIELNKNAAKDGLQLVAAGTLFDIQTALTVTESELHPIEVQCRNATIYPEIDGRQPAIRRSQLLDALLYANNKPLLFSRLSVEQQLQAGNAMMKLIESRAGSFENAVEFVEAQGRLKQLGIVDDDLVATMASVGDQGVAMAQVLRDLRSKKSLPAPMEEEGA